jgi:hypothetical protein
MRLGEGSCPGCAPDAGYGGQQVSRESDATARVIQSRGGRWLGVGQSYGRACPKGGGRRNVRRLTVTHDGSPRSPVLRLVLRGSRAFTGNAFLVRSRS